jgi:cation transport ATPase
VRKRFQTEEERTREEQEEKVRARDKAAAYARAKERAKESERAERRAERREAQARERAQAHAAWEKAQEKVRAEAEAAAQVAREVARIKEIQRLEEKESRLRQESKFDFKCTLGICLYDMLSGIFYVAHHYALAILFLVVGFIFVLIPLTSKIHCAIVRRKIRELKYPPDSTTNLLRESFRAAFCMLVPVVLSAFLRWYWITALFVVLITFILSNAFKEWHRSRSPCGPSSEKPI